MVDIKLLREDPELFQKGAKKKGFDVNIDEVLKIDEKRRRLQASIDRRRKELGLKSNLMKKAEGKQRDKLQEELRDFSKSIKIDELKLHQREVEFERALLCIPNPPLDDVPVGADEADRVS